MTISVSEVSKYICELGNWKISNLRLQKLLYMTHLFYMGTNNNPLIDEKFEAWDYGPVLPSLYHKVKIFGADPIRPIRYLCCEENAKMKDKERSVIDNVFNELKDKSGGQLISLTHRKKGAWYKNYDQNNRSKIIPNEDIKAEYKEYF